jgi:hypothetical protein
VLRWEGRVVNEGLMLLHSSVKRDIVVLAPSSKRVEKEDWVLVSLLHQLLSGVLKEKDVSVVKWVSNLESIDGISASLKSLSIDLSWGHSV